MEPATEDAHLPHSFRVTSNISPNMYPTLIEKDCILFYHPSCKELAEKTAAASKSIELGAIDWRCARSRPPPVTEAAIATALPTAQIPHVSVPQCLQ